jgi:uncharacterized protein YhfF
MTDRPDDVHEAELQAFWEVARVRANLNRLSVYSGPTPLDILRPPDWSFGRTPELADKLLSLVLDGSKTATASALADYAAEGEPVPQVGDLSIVTDGAGHPRALVVTTDVQVVPFDEVTEEHANAEGEGDRSLAHWRAVHEPFFTEGRAGAAGVDPDMMVVCERFRVLHSA